MQFLRTKESKTSIFGGLNTVTNSLDIYGPSAARITFITLQLFLTVIFVLLVLTTHIVRRMHLVLQEKILGSAVIQ